MLDSSGANEPKLVDDLIPVMYKDNNWVKADSTNTDENNQWYDYDAKKWANAVLVSSTNRSTYQNANAGTVIPESDVLAYYVWIPRYKYKVWNINKVINTDSYGAQSTGIDIIFENEKESTGTVKCNSYSFAAPNSTTPNESCSGSNGDYYTHPAFTFGNDELEGIWVGKFEISSGTPSASYGGGNSTTLTVRIKPNVTSWRYNALTSFWKVIYDMQKSSNIYGLSIDRTNTDSHMMKNMEWGAVAYLTNSKYGKCLDNLCSEVAVNSNSSFITGGNDYVSNISQSTTGNIYGIYDMNGGAYDALMGNMSSDSGSYSYYVSSGGSNFTYNTSNSKYLDTYANGSSYNDQIAYNRARLGDATGEVVQWYDDAALFMYSSYSWIRHGGRNNGDELNPGIFSFVRVNGTTYNDVTTRAALVSLSS